MQVHFEVECRETQLGQAVLVVGSDTALGQWSVGRALVLETSRVHFPLWWSRAPVHLARSGPVEFKFALCGPCRCGPVHWEAFQHNRRLESTLGSDLVVRAVWNDPKGVVTVRETGAALPAKRADQVRPVSLGMGMADLALGGSLVAAAGSAGAAVATEAREWLGGMQSSRPSTSDIPRSAHPGIEAAFYTFSGAAEADAAAGGGVGEQQWGDLAKLHMMDRLQQAPPCGMAMPYTWLAPVVGGAGGMPHFGSTGSATRQLVGPGWASRFSSSTPEPAVSQPASAGHAAHGGPMAPRRPRGRCHEVGCKPRHLDVPVVLVASEISPWSKTGGLGLVAASLARELALQGHRTMVVCPMYEPPSEAEGFKPAGSGWVHLAGRQHEVQYFRSCRDVGSGHCCDFVLVGHDCFRNRPHGLYCDLRTGAEYQDNPFRFALLSLAALEAPLVLAAPGGGDYGERLLFLANDWQASLVPVYLAHRYRPSAVYVDARAVYVVHNLGYQGQYSVDPRSLASTLGLDSHAIRDAELGGCLNLSKAALLCADRVITVSPNYAHETCTREGGSGLDEFVRRQAAVGRLAGIRNGIDDSWNPEVDPHIARNYGRRDFLPARRECKAALQRALGLDEEPQAAVLGFVGRLAYQKGVDILGRVVQWLVCDAAVGIGSHVQLVMMGDGEAPHSKMLHWAERSFPGRVCGLVGFDPVLEHLMMAGCDLVLVPSRYEPCGLPQLVAQAYGALPVVSATGGLLDSVRGAEEGLALATGFLVPHPVGEAGLRHTLRQALQAFFIHPEQFQQMQRNAMARDFSWPRAVAEYQNQIDLTLNEPPHCQRQR